MGEGDAVGEDLRKGGAGQCILHEEGHSMTLFGSGVKEVVTSIAAELLQGGVGTPKPELLESHDLGSGRHRVKDVKYGGHFVRGADAVDVVGHDGKGGGIPLEGEENPRWW